MNLELEVHVTALVHVRAAVASVPLSALSSIVFVNLQALANVQVTTAINNWSHVGKN